MLDRLTECEEILCSQIIQLHDILRVVTNGQITPSVVSPNGINSVMDEITHKIPIDLQLGFESGFDIWHVYKYPVTTLILHDNEIHLIMKIPLTDRDISVSLIRVYDIPVPLPQNTTANSKLGIFAQYDLRASYMTISGGCIKKLTKSEYDDCIFAAGRFCTALTHMVAAEHTKSCLFALYSENDDNIQRYCSIQFSEKCLPYVKSLTELQWYIATRDRLELAITCPRKSYRQIILPPFSIFSLQQFCIGFSAQVKLFAPIKTLGSVDWKLKLIWCTGDPKLTTGFLIISVPML